MLIGYARISTKYQSLDMQIEALKKEGCEKIYQDQMSGSSNNRPGLLMALEAIRKGDTLVVWKLDRLGRCVRNLVELFNNLSSTGVNFKSLTDNIDTSTPMGTFLFHIMAGLAQMERDLTSERIRAGIANAKNRGMRAGRKRVMTDSKIESARKLLATGMKMREVANDLGIAIPTFYRWIPKSTVPLVKKVEPEFNYCIEISKEKLIT